jgi:DNA-binding CsgD family transcriptional regulator
MSYLHRAEILRVLTRREQDVVERVAKGLEIKEIAHDLGIGYQTVKMHIRGAKGKLGARNQLELAILMHGGQPSSMPDAHKHPLHSSGQIDREPAWHSHLRFNVSHH